MTPHLLVAISSHGYGHLAQTSPIIRALQNMAEQGRVSTFGLTIRSSLPPDQISMRVAGEFNLDSGSDDFGMVMHDALQVDLARSLQRYAMLHQHWDASVNRLAHHLTALGITGVMANAPYLTLAAAHLAGLPSIGICSLNWGDILERCVTQQPMALKASGVTSKTLANILQQMRQAYACADMVIQPEPALEASHLQALTIEPITHAPVAADRDGLLQTLRRQTSTHGNNPIPTDGRCWLVLTSMGGIGLNLDPQRWPSECLGRPVFYLMAKDTATSCPHIIALDFDEIGFDRLMASCDLVLTKPGYGMFVQTRTCCKPMLYVARDDWPESPCLEQWASTHAQASKLTREQVKQGEFTAELRRLLTLPALTPVAFDGAQQAADLVAKHLLS